MADVGQVQARSLGLDHFRRVGNIFCAFTTSGPAQFLNNDVFGRWQKGEESFEVHTLPTGETGLIVWIISDEKQLDFECGRRMGNDVTHRHCDRLK